MAAPRHDNTKRLICEATGSMLRTRSFAEISLAEIASKAGISKGTLFYHYASKDDILFDIADEHLEALSRSLVEWADNEQKDTSLPRLYNYVLRRGVYNESGALRLYLVAAAVAGNERLRERFWEKYSHFKAELCERIAARSGADAQYKTWLILTVMDGMLVQSQLQNPDFPSEEFIEKTVAMLCGL